jgi:hypothetical protein
MKMFSKSDEGELAKQSGDDYLLYRFGWINFRSIFKTLTHLPPLWECFFALRVFCG